MENIRENTRVRKSVMDTREQFEHGCAKSFRDRGAIYTRETKTPNRGVKVQNWKLECMRRERAF